MNTFNVGVLAIWLFVATKSVFCQDPIVKLDQTDPPVNALTGAVEAEMGDDVTLPCVVENLVEGATVRWQRQYVDLDGREQVQKLSQDEATEDNIKYSLEKPYQYTWKLRISNVVLSDEGVYVCQVYTTRTNKVEISVPLIVYVAPRFIPEELSWDTTVKEGDNVDLNCGAEGRPTPMVEWRRLGGQLLPIGRQTLREPELHIPNVSPEAQGIYECRVQNLKGEQRWLIHLIVQHRPRIVAITNVEQAVGYRIELQCLIEANPRPGAEDITWSKGGQTITQSVEDIQVNRVDGAFNKLTYELILHNVKKEDFGTYTCRAKNSLGTQQRNIKLTESKEPQQSVKLGQIISGSSSNAVVTITTVLLCLVTLFFQVL